MPFDKIIEDIAEYVSSDIPFCAEAYSTAQLCLADSLACAFLALSHPTCLERLGPFIPGETTNQDILVPGTKYRLNPIQAAFNIGTMIRWLDYNDTWLAAEWGHPSDNLGSILSVGQYVAKSKKITIHDILHTLIQAHEIQGVLALQNSLNAHGFDHVLFVKIASTAVSAKLLGCSTYQIAAALSNAFIDCGPLRTYRHAPNTGPRKSWAAGDATSRAVQIAFQATKGEHGYASALTAHRWGFQDVILQGKPLVLERPLGSYVMENVLFKVKFPAEFHAQTAVEAGITLHPSIKDRINDIERIDIQTHLSAIRIIAKEGKLHNFADRDHCLQYMVAVAILFGNLKAEYYWDDFAAAHPEIDELRAKMHVTENPQYSKDYHDPDKRSIASSLTLYFKDGTHLPTVEVEYPIGHKRRRPEALPFLKNKLVAGLKVIHSEHLISLFPPDESMLLTDFINKLI